MHGRGDFWKYCDCRNSPRLLLVAVRTNSPYILLVLILGNMMFPGGVGSSELQQAAAEKVKKDIGTFVIFGLLIEAVAVGASYLNVEGFLI